VPDSSFGGVRTAHRVRETVPDGRTGNGKWQASDERNMTVAFVGWLHLNDVRSRNIRLLHPEPCHRSELAKSSRGGFRVKRHEQLLSVIKWQQQQNVKQRKKWGRGSEGGGRQKNSSWIPRQQLMPIINTKKVTETNVDKHSNRSWRIKREQSI